ncbi:MAG: hypothetical protein LH654_13855 [Thermoleophilia bacterium]|nr:hypothetical protein [Thermoleophilia bacterium]
MKESNATLPPVVAKALTTLSVLMIAPGLAALAYSVAKLVRDSERRHNRRRARIHRR